MAALDPINVLLVLALAAIFFMFAQDTLGPTLLPTLQRYRARYIPRGVTWRMFIPLGLFVLLAVLMHVPLVSMYLVAAGLLITVHQLQRLKREQRIIQPGQILQFLLAFRGEYFLQPAPFASLSRAMSKTDEPLKSLLNVMVQTYFLTSSPERAFAELRNRTDNAYLNQFAYILEMSESASADSVVKAVDNLVERLRTHDELRREIKANLSSITSQTSILQAVAIGVLLIVAIVPSLHRAYISIGAQIFYITFMTIMLASSYYIEREIDKLAERVT